MGLSDNLRNIEAEIAAGHPEQALALCLELQTRYPRALAVQRVLGEAYLALRKPREALGALDRALAGNPEDARACCARAIVQQIHGDAVSALKWYRRACDISPDDQVLRSAYRELASSQGQLAYHPTRMGLARLYLRGDLFSHAIREWESLLAEEPDSLEVQVALAETLWRAQRFQPATERCERILINAPSCVKAILILAVIEHDIGHVDVAQRLVRRTADLDPDCRIGQMLCADRLAAGDDALRALFMTNEESAGHERVASHPLGAPLANIPTSAPAGVRTGLPSEPLPQPSVLRSPSVKSQPIGGTNPLVQSPASEQQPRSNALPANFRNIFAETEYMLWGKDADEFSETSRLAPMTPGSIPNLPTASDQFARSNVFVPPVLRDHGVNLDETDARTSINFVNWLQAQGALQQDSIPVPPRVPPITRQLPPLPQQQTTSVPLSGTLPQQVASNSEELRKMFAELGQQTGTHKAVEDGVERQFTRSGFHEIETGSSDLSSMMGYLDSGQPDLHLPAEPLIAESVPELLMPAQEVEPADYPARLERARLRRSTGQIDGALADYRLVLKNAPDLLGDVMDDLNDSLEETPDHPEIHRLLGDAYIRQGNYLQALEAYNRAVALAQAQNG